MKRILFLALLAAIVTSAAPSTHCFTNANLTLVNNSGACCYRAIFMQSGSQTFLFPASGSTTFTAALAPGVYSLGVAPLLGASGTHNFSYSSGPDNGSQTGTSALFSNVTVYSGGTVTVSIN